MANTSILAAFERMWQHITGKFNAVNNTISELDEKIIDANNIASQKAQVQIITWGDND